jgi:hypothetical protein
MSFLLNLDGSNGQDSFSASTRVSIFPHNDNFSFRLKCAEMEVRELYAT